MDTTFCHISYGTRDDCVNYWGGEICIWCNCCGRVNEKTKWHAQVNLYKEMLENEHNFDQWADSEDMRALQERNIKKNVEYFNEKLDQATKMMEQYESLN